MLAAAKLCMYYLLFTPPKNPQRKVLFSLHFTDEETEVPSGDMTARLTEPAGGKARIQTLGLQRAEKKLQELCTEG